MDKKGMWSFHISTAGLVLIPAAVGINYVGKFLAALLKLPLWVDSIGTVLAAMMGGPIIGALAGAVNNIIYGLTTDPVSFVYAITSIAIGLVVGVLSYKGFTESFSKAALLGVIVGLLATVVSTPINIGFWGGQTGNVWGDALFASVMSGTGSVWLASFLDEIVVDIPDKLLTVIISFLIFKSLPKSIMGLYNTSDEIESL